MSPEGTRSKVKEWKTGFLRIARELNTKIIPASIDFASREIYLAMFLLLQEITLKT